MAWTHANQQMAHMNGAGVEYGKGTMGTAGTVEINTHFKNIYAATATWIAAGTVRTILIDSNIMCDLANTSDCVTFADSAGTANAGATFSYILIGR